MKSIYKWEPEMLPVTKQNIYGPPKDVWFPRNLSSYESVQAPFMPHSKNLCIKKLIWEALQHFINNLQNIIQN